MSEEVAIEVTGPIRPGDVLLIRVSSEVRDRQQFNELVAEVSARLKERMSDVELCFIAGADQILHYRPESS